MSENIWKYLFIFTFLISAYLFYVFSQNTLFSCIYTARDLFYLLKEQKSVEEVRQDILRLQVINGKIKGEIRKYYNKIPTVDETAKILKMLKKIADENKLIIVQIVPQKIEKQKNFSVQEIECVVVGSFGGCISFLDYFDSKVLYVRIANLNFNQRNKKVEMKLNFIVFYKNESIESV